MTTRTIFGAQLSANNGRRGGWITFPFIIGAVLGLTVSGSGWLTNMTVYLIEKYHVKNVGVTQISNIIYGCSNLIPLLGAIVADSMFSCFSVILFSAVGSLLGVFLLFLTAMLPALRPPPCDPGFSACEPPGHTQYVALYIGITLGCAGIGGTRFTIATMGANQFKMAKDQETFFNWYFFGLYSSAVVGNTVILYVEDSVSWAWGFAICVALNFVGIVIFLMGNRYFHHDKLHGSPFTSLAQVVVASISKMGVPLSFADEDYYYGHNVTVGESGLTPTESFRFLNRAALIIKADAQAENPKLDPWKLCTVRQVEDLKSILRIFPIWSTAIVLCTIISINNSFAVLQALVTDRHLASNFKIPAGSMLVFVLLSAAVFLPIIDRIIYPGYKRLANRYPTPLQRIGTGHIINVAAMALSAMVESKRLQLVRIQSFKNPDLEVPMSALWLVPQLVLIGIGEAFHFAGQVAFYYSEFPTPLHTTATAMQALIIGIAYYLSSAVIGLVRRVTDWLPDNLNDGKLDCFYWMLTMLAVLNFVCYLVSAMRYKYQRKEEGGDATTTGQTL